MLRVLRPALAALLVYGAACGGPTRPDFHRVEFRDNTALADGMTLRLADPDDPAHPTAWQGPLEIAGRCTANLSLVTAVYVSPGARYLVVATYNGSQRYAHFVDATNCRELWPAKQASHDFTVAADGLSAPEESRWQLFPDRPPQAR